MTKRIHESFNAWAPLDMSLVDEYGNHPVDEDAWDYTSPVIFLSLILPAKHCNMDCIFCPITGVNREPVTGTMSPEDLLAFVNSFLWSGLYVPNLAAQGFEPTLPESWPYMMTVFNKNNFLIPPGPYRSFFIPRTSFVTNGLLLAKRAEDIAKTLKIDRISISVDSGDARFNDHWRGKRGALEKTVASVLDFKEQIENLKDQTDGYEPQMSIATVLRGPEAMDGMLELLDKLAINNWTLSPAVRLDADGQVVLEHGLDEIVDLIQDAHELIEGEGKKLSIVDEFNTLALCRDQIPADSLVYNLPNPEHAIRAYANWTYVKGPDILRPYAESMRNYRLDQDECIYKGQDQYEPDRSKPLFLHRLGYNVPPAAKAYEQRLELEKMMRQAGVPVENPVDESRLIDDVTPFLSPPTPPLRRPQIPFPEDGEILPEPSERLRLRDLATPRTPPEPE